MEIVFLNFLSHFYTALILLTDFSNFQIFFRAFPKFLLLENIPKSFRNYGKIFLSKVLLISQSVLKKFRIFEIVLQCSQKFFKIILNISAKYLLNFGTVFSKFIQNFFKVFLIFLRND